MKKAFCVLLVILLILSSAACGNKEEPGESSMDSMNSAQSGNPAESTESGGDSDTGGDLELDDDGDLTIEDILQSAWGTDPDGETETAPEEPPLDPSPYPDFPTPEHSVLNFAGMDWLVLETGDGKALIMSVDIIDFLPYRLGNFSDVTWRDSMVRTWLNGTFYDETFSADEKAWILDSQITNDNNPWFGTYGGAETTDKLFLLSIEETVRYFGDSGFLATRTDEDVWSVDDKYNEARIAVYIETDYKFMWWLRSPGNNGMYAAYVDNDGTISVSGLFIGESGGGIRPAMWIMI
ncbi:MAG: DUF6273 domain-containing protein [Oscillospiraceae bacterium]|nr:DUF6273 domain-containing protein [Oscillospiraceae bacterium]